MTILPSADVRRSMDTMSWKTKPQRFGSYFRKAEVRSPIIGKPHVWSPIIGLFSCVISDKCLDCPHGIMEWIRSDSSSLFDHHREHGFLASYCHKEKHLNCRMMSPNWRFLQVKWNATLPLTARFRFISTTITIGPIVFLNFFLAFCTQKKRKA